LKRYGDVDRIGAGGGLGYTLNSRHSLALQYLSRRAQAEKAHEGVDRSPQRLEPGSVNCATSVGSV